MQFIPSVYDIIYGLSVLKQVIIKGGVNRKNDEKKNKRIHKTIRNTISYR